MLTLNRHLSLSEMLAALANFKDMLTFLKRLTLISLPLSLLFHSSALFSADLSYKVEGLDGELENNVELFLEALPELEVSDLPRFRDNIISSTTKALQALGYYQSTIQLNLDNSNEKKPELTVTVDAGKPVVYRTIKIRLEGEAKENPAFEQLLKESPIQSGEPLNHGTYDDFKNKFTSLGQSLGFFDAHFSHHSVDVYPEQYIADLYLTYSSGQRYAFGDIRYGSVPEPMEHLIKTMVTIKPGDPYDVVQLGNLNKDLSSTNYFQSISVEPQRSDVIDYHVPILINVTLNRNHELETGVGFSTDEGPRVSLNWDKPVINDRGHSLTNEFLVSGKRAAISSNYKIPYGNPLLEYYNLQAGYRYKDLEDTKSDLTTAAVHRWKKNPKGWDKDIFFRIQYESYQQASQDDKSLLLIPGFSLSKRQANGSLDPSHGYLLMMTVEVSEKSWGSDASFLKVWGRSKGLTTVAEKHRFIARADQGAIWIDDILNVPPSIRFFTGGDQTVRGYAYESLSPKDKNGKLIGGQYMSAVSLEYDYEFIKNWRTAVFVDSGTATNDYDDSWKTGTGFGIRWISPVGPIRLDLAFAVSEKGSPWRIHFSMGPEL